MFSCFRRLLLLDCSRACKYGPWCVFGWKQWMHHVEWIFASARAWQTMITQMRFCSARISITALCLPPVQLTLSSCGRLCSSQPWWLADTTGLRVAGMRPRLCSGGDAVPQTQPSWTLKRTLDAPKAWFQSRKFNLDSLFHPYFSPHYVFTI